MKTLFLEIPPAALYVIIAACAIIVIAGIAVAVYLQIKKKQSAKVVQKETVQPVEEQVAQQEEQPAEEPAPLPAPEEQPADPLSNSDPSCHSEQSEKSPAPAQEEQPAEPLCHSERSEESPVPAQSVEAVQEEDEKDEPDDEDDENEDEDETEIAPQRQVARTANGHVRYIIIKYNIIKYNKSFTAKLIQSSDINKEYYSQLKNELLSYSGIKARTSWKYETFYAGRQTFARLSVRGKKLCLFLSLDPKNYVDTKYVIDDKSNVLAYEKTPLLYRIKNDRRLKYSKELIATAMQGRGKTEEFKEVNYSARLPYEEIEPLIERKLVKVLTEEDAQSGDVFKPRDFVQAAEVNELLQDDIAQALIEVSDEVSDRTKCEIINVDILSRYFENDERVTLEEIKKSVPKFPKNATYIKVLARGALDKRLTVVADAYSIEAAKMILLTGGNPIRKK